MRTVRREQPSQCTPPAHACTPHLVVCRYWSVPLPHVLSVLATCDRPLACSCRRLPHAAAPCSVLCASVCACTLSNTAHAVLHLRFRSCCTALIAMFPVPVSVSVSHAMHANAHSVAPTHTPNSWDLLSSTLSDARMHMNSCIIYIHMCRFDVHICVGEYQPMHQEIRVHV